MYTWIGVVFVKVIDGYGFPISGLRTDTVGLGKLLDGVSRRDRSTLG